MAGSYEGTESGDGAAVMVITENNNSWMGEKEK